MNAALLEVDGLVKRFGGFVALSGIDLAVAPGERFGLIGPNGSGKTTLINCVSGALVGEAGRVLFDGRDVTRVAAHRRTRLGIARSFQIPKPFKSMSVRDNVRVPLEYAGGLHDKRHDVDGEADAVLTLVGLAALAGQSAAALNQIELRKLELARALAARPRLLIVDEAMAGLSTNEVDEILEILFDLNKTGIAVIMIEHIMRAVMRYCERIVVLDAGVKIAEGGPEAILSDAAVEKAYLGE